jgi:TnpA family transposase
LAAVRQHRGDHNRLGFAVQLCYLRYPGRVLAENETPPATLLGIVAAQLQVQPALWGQYAQRDETRREHLIELQHLYGFDRSHHGSIEKSLRDSSRWRIKRIRQWYWCLRH